MERQVAKAARSLTAEGGGLPGLAGALVPILSSQA